MSESAKIVPSAFSQLAGVSDEKPRTISTNIDELKRTPIAKYSPAEISSIINSLYVSDKVLPNPNISNAEGLISYFLPIHEQIGQVILDTRKMKKLAPEIDQAKLIRTSSIMSPNDMQEGRFIYDIEQVPGLTDEAKKRIIDEIDKFFNDVIKLGKKANKWIGDCLYESGATPILILPTSIQSAMHDKGKQVVGTSSYTDKILDRKKTLTEIENTLIYSDPVNSHLGLESWSAPFKLEENKPKHKDFTKFMKDILKEYPLHAFNRNDQKTIIAGLESMTVNFVKEIEEGDVIKLTENPEIIKFATEYRKSNKQKLANKLDEHFNAHMSYQPEEMISLNKYENIAKDKKDIGHPLLLEIPTESVIPICVPSDEREHLGYFILLDEYGQPIKADPQFMNNTYGWGGSPQAATQAMYGNMNNGGVFQSGTFKNYEEVTMRRVFNGLLDQYLKAKLKGIGWDAVDIQKTNAITTTMLYRLMEHKKTRVLFVPCDLLMYICFDYRKNGTGKTLVEDIHYPLSLRISFQVASMMGMAKDAINHRTLNVTLDDKDTNPLALMEQLANLFVEKERMPFPLDPMEASSTMVRRAVSIVPKNMRGLSDFAIDKTNEGTGGGSRPDTELLEALTNMIVTALGVPYSALNALAEQEYAKSITTTNLFFSKQIRSDQETLCNYIEEITRTYIKYSPKLKKKIMDILKEFMQAPDKTPEKNNRGTIPSTQPSPEIEEDVTNKINTILNMILINLRVTLPTPNIAQDKAQYEEINNYITALENYLNIVFANELVPSDNIQATNALNMARANIKARAVIDFMSKIGTINTMQIPTLEDFVKDYDVADTIQMLLNFYKDIETTITTYGGNTDQMGMGGGMDMMGGDMMGGEGEMGMNNGMDDMGMSGESDVLESSMDNNTESAGTDNFMPEEVPSNSPNDTDSSGNLV